MTAPPIRFAMAPIAASPAAAEELLIQPDASAQKGPFIEYAPVRIMLRIARVAKSETLTKAANTPAAIMNSVSAVCQRRSLVRSECRPQTIIRTDARP